MSIADYPILGDGSSAGGSSSTGQRADEYERLTQRIRESIAAVQAETAAQAGLNPLIDDYGYAVEKARVEQDLLNAAQEAGKDITPELSAGISDLAHQYATAYAEARKLSESQDEIRKRAEEWADVSKDVVGGFIQDLRNGTSAADALANALQKVADKLLNEVLDAIFEVNGAGGGLWGAIGGMLGGGFGRFPGGFGAPTPGVGLFAKGTDYAPGGLAIVGEEGPELVNLPRGSQVIPNHKLGGMGGPSITYAPQIDARGASVEAVARLEQIIAKDRAEFQAKVVNIVRDRPNKRW